MIDTFIPMSLLLMASLHSATVYYLMLMHACLILCNITHNDRLERPGFHLNSVQQFTCFTAFVQVRHFVMTLKLCYC